MTEPPRYRALQRIELHPAGEKRRRVIKPGEQFDYFDRPPVSLMPLNHSARAAKADGIEAHHTGPGYCHVMLLARSLGFVGHDKHAASQHIRKFLALELAKENA